eukprot:15470585-Alexandrium_andersonii.AAC.1
MDAWTTGDAMSLALTGGVDCQPGNTRARTHTHTHSKGYQHSPDEQPTDRHDPSMARDSASVGFARSLFPSPRLLSARNAASGARDTWGCAGLPGGKAWVGFNLPVRVKPSARLGGCRTLAEEGLRAMTKQRR